MELINWRNEVWTGQIIAEVNQKKVVGRTRKNKARTKKKMNLTLSIYQRSTFTRR
jgi:hypothetical protein